MRVIFIAVLLGVLSACGSKEDSASNETTLAITSASKTVEELKSNKASTDALFIQNRNQVSVLVKRENSDFLTEVYNENWPANIEIIYNILVDSTGNVVRISELPYSESGDWSIMYSHYFDTRGSTFAFERRIKAFNNFCPGDDDFDQLTEETITKFYSPEHTLIDSTYRMTDELNLDITSKRCQQEVESESQVFKTVREYTVAKGIKTAANK